MEVQDIETALRATIESIAPDLHEMLAREFLLGADLYPALAKRFVKSLQDAKDARNG